jgi:GT2 family glycosyltransferase
MNLSVIIPTLNDVDQLRGLLFSLRNQDIEIICGDGGSTDGTMEAALSMGAKCVIKEGGGGIECANLAAWTAEGDVFLFLACDVRIGGDAVRRVVSRFENDATLLGLTGRPISRGGPSLCRLEYEAFWLLASLLRRMRFVASGSFVAVRRDAFIEIGGFPEGYNSDGEFSLRLGKAGKTTTDRSLVYEVSARRYNSLGFFGFTRQYLYVLEDLIPVKFRTLGPKLQAEHYMTGGRIR